jgi:integrase
LHTANQPPHGKALLRLNPYTSNDVPIDVISKMLGHTNVRMTQVYAMVTQDKLFEEADKFIEATKDFALVLNANSKEVVNKQRQ